MAISGVGAGAAWSLGEEFSAFRRVRQTPSLRPRGRSGSSAPSRRGEISGWPVRPSAPRGCQRRRTRNLSTCMRHWSAP